MMHLLSSQSFFHRLSSAVCNSLSAAATLLSSGGVLLRNHNVQLVVVQCVNALTRVHL